MTLVAIVPFHSGTLVGFAIAPGTGKGYLVARGSSNQLLELDLQTLAVLRTAPLPGYGYVVASPDGSTVYVSAGAIYAFSTQTMTVTGSSEVLYLGFLSITPDGEYIYGTDAGQFGTTPGGVDILSTSSLAVVGAVPGLNPSVQPSAVIFVRD